MKVPTKTLMVVGLIQGLVIECAADQISPADVEPEIQVEIIKPIYRNPNTKDNCDVWVQMSYENPQNIADNELVIIDSKPPGEFDDEAIKALLSYLSYEQRPHLNSMLFVKNNKDGSREHTFTYFKGCNKKGAAREKPNTYEAPFSQQAQKADTGAQ